MKHYSTKELLQISDTAPASIRDALSSENTITTITNLGVNLKLHVDQLGLVAELNVQMLLGLVNPQEFLQELIAAGVPDADAREIMTEINQKIFVPLREEMRKGSAQPPRPAEVRQPVSVAGPQAPLMSQQGMIIPANPSLPPRQSQVTVSMPRYIPSTSTKWGSQASPVLPKSPPAPARRQTDTSRLLEDHEEPHIELGKAPAPLRIFPPRPIAAPPQNLPGVMQPPPIPKPPTASPPPAPPASYSNDPYREPIEP